MILNLVIKSAWILTNNEVQDEIGHSSFGSYAGLSSLGFLFIAFSDFGLNQYATKTLAGEPSRLKALFPNLFTLKLALTLIYPIFMMGAGWVLGYNETEIGYLFLLCLTQAIVQVIFFFRANFQAFQKFRIDAIASVMDRLVLLIIILILLFTDRMNLDHYILAGLASVVLSMIVLYGFILKMFGFMAPRFKAGKLKALLRASLPFAVITIMYSVLDKVDQVMLERMAGKHETGLYAGAYRWVDAVMMYLWTILPIFFARFAFYIRDAGEQKRLLDFGQVLAAIPMIFAAGFVWFYGDKLLFLFDRSTAAELASMERLLQILFIAVGLNGIFAVFSTLLTSTNHERFVSWVIFGAIVLNIVLNAIFIPEFGAEASAWSTVICYGALSLTYIIYIQVRLPFNISWINLLKLGVVAGLFGLGYWGLTLTALPWYANTVLAGGLLLGLGFVFGLINLRMFRKNG